MACRQLTGTKTGPLASPTTQSRIGIAVPRTPRARRSPRSAPLGSHAKPWRSATPWSPRTSPRVLWITGWFGLPGMVHAAPTVPTVRLDSRVENVRAESASGRETVGESGMAQGGGRGWFHRKRHQPEPELPTGTTHANSMESRATSSNADGPTWPTPAEDPTQWSPEARTNSPIEVSPSSVGVPVALDPATSDQR